DARGGKDSAVVVDTGLRAIGVDGTAAGTEHGTGAIVARLHERGTRGHAGRFAEKLRWDSVAGATVLRPHPYGITGNAAANAIAAWHFHAAVAAQRATKTHQPVAEGSRVDDIRVAHALPRCLSSVRRSAATRPVAAM